jgi:hypothetical protein
MPLVAVMRRVAKLIALRQWVPSSLPTLYW